MASPTAMVTAGKKLSFAKVAASRTKEPSSAVAIARSPDPATAKERREPTSAAPPTTSSSPPAPVAVTNGTTNGTTAMASTTAPPGRGKPRNPNVVTESKIVEGLKDLELETKTPNLVVNGTGSTVTERSSKTGNSQSPSDEISQRADSISELDTKPPSLDGKSITSGTTFALDEKESLRPDDSASVKAAAEDDDAFSIRGSLVASGSRMGSEVAARVHRIQLGDMPTRTITTHVLIDAHTQGAVTPQTGVLEKPPVPDPNLPLASAAVGPDGLASNGIYRQNPDDKLLEAMQSPKDRLFLLRLEAQVIEFVQDSKEPFMDLPPCNSFCRMLTHRLADYYHMTHSFEAVAGAVRIFRTPFCRVPPPLSSIVVNPSNNTSPAPALLPRRIMRRDRDGELGSLSAGASKPTSEDGSDSKEKGAPAKEKLTREEREEAYNKARERIFGSLEKMESPAPENDDSNGVSRASSVSARDKSKRKTAKQRRDDSESFDSRSQYVAWCTPQQQTWVSPQYIPVGAPQFSEQFQQPRPNAVQPVYGPNPSYPQVMPNNAYAPQYNTIPPVEYHPQPAQPAQPAPQAVPQQQRYPTQNAPIAPYPPPALQAAPQQGWQQTSCSQSPYQARATPAAPGIPYAYGQLPVNVHPNDPKSQHPIPGSYNRHAFNPKTQSFVPANGMAPMQPPALPYGGGSPHHGGSPQFHALPVNYTGYQQPIPQPPPYMGNGSGYGMVRQGSNNSMPQYHPGQMPPQPPIPHGPPHGPQAVPPGQPPHIPNKPAMPQGPSQTFSTLPTYGNPATLPQKPGT